MGYYGGAGARKVATVTNTTATRQPAPLTDSTGLTDAGNWSVSASWQVPTDAVSGVYIAKLVRDDGTLGENNMYFVVRDDDGRSDTLFQTSDSTWEAYNLYGGEDFYTGSPSSPTQAHKVSYNRPFGDDDKLGQRAADGCRVSDDPLDGSQRLQRELHDGCGYGTQRSGAARTQGVPVGGSRRVLVERAKSERRSCAGCRRRSRLFQR